MEGPPASAAAPRTMEHVRSTPSPTPPPPLEEVPFGAPRLGVGRGPASSSSATAPLRSTAAAATATAAESSTCVEVNIGGTIFIATAGTLRKSPFFASLLSDELVDDLRDAEGRLFVDRDPELFAEVLRLLRGYQPRIERHGWGVVKAEADFYQIPLDCLRPPVEVLIPPDILVVRHVFAYNGTRSTESLRADEVCVYCLGDVPPDLKTQIRIDSVHVNRHQSGSKTVFVVSQQVIEEAGFFQRAEGFYERTERRCYHKKSGLELVIPKHPMEVEREHQEHYLCITYVIPVVGPVVTTHTGGVVGIQLTGVVRRIS